jgi:lipopolysaccharide biosynthesis glycosyltransferase
MIPIVFTFNRNWVTAAAVCFYSLLKNKNKTTNYELIVIHSELLETDEIYLQKQLQSYHNTFLRFIKIDNSLINSFELTKRGSAPFSSDCYTRLFIPDILNDYDKVIYSDVDVVFMGDLAEVFEADLSDNYLGVVKDVRMNNKILKGKQKYFSDKYFNHYFYAGFLCMNLQKIRNDKLRNVFIREAQKGHKTQDQDVLNISCYGSVRYLHQKYTILTYNININRTYLENMNIFKEYEEALAEPVIYHYAGREKPWLYALPDMAHSLWWNYCREACCFNKKSYLLAKLRYYLFRLSKFERKFRKLFKKSYIFKM